MTLNFPDNPSTNDTYTAPSGTTFVWDGSRWNIDNSATSQLRPGVDAWAVTNGTSGNTEGSFNLTSTRSSAGVYDYTFVTPMPSANYAVVATVLGGGNASDRIVSTALKTTTGFRVVTNNAGTTFTDNDHSVVVHATNATLPNSFTENEIQNVVDLAQSGSTNPGASAWGYTTVGGGFLSGLNIASMSNPSTGVYEYTFITPMPSAQYSVQATAYSPTSEVTVNWTSTSATGFTLRMRSSDGSLVNNAHTFVVFATNALPLKGGTGADAWAAADSDGTIGASFNFTGSNSRTSLGTYDYTFTTPMPTADYAVVATQGSPNQRSISVRLKTVNGFRVQIRRSDTTSVDLMDAPHDVVVHATNATLPDSFTENEIQNVVDLAQSGATNPGASAWGKSSGGNGGVLIGLNVASITKTATGTYAVVFTTPMPTNSYAVTANGAGAGRMVTVGSQTATGFNLVVETDAGSAIDSTVYFTVFATNALPLKGGTGADAWGTTYYTGILQGSYNIASVTRVSGGVYDYVFFTPMPDTNYTVLVTPSTNSPQDKTASLGSTNKTVNGFTVRTASQGAASDVSHSVVVHATNATLPAPLTQDSLLFVDGRNAAAEIDVEGLATFRRDTGNEQRLQIECDAVGNYLKSFSYDTAQKDLYIENNSVDRFIRFNAGGSESMRVMPAGGITFNGDAAAANTLNDYEEGTFTAHVSSSGNVNGSMATSTGRYTKIGRVVRITVKLLSNGTSTSGHSGNVIIRGLPFIGGTSTMEQIAAPITYNSVYGKYVMALDFPSSTPYLTVLNSVVYNDYTPLFPNGANIRYYFSLSYTIYD